MSASVVVLLTGLAIGLALGFFIASQIRHKLIQLRLASLPNLPEQRRWLQI
jgi:uncharacterized protein YneF (UPF0154 family)